MTTKINSEITSSPAEVYYMLQYVTDFKHSHWVIVNVDFALWSLHRLDVGSVTRSTLKVEEACTCKIVSNTPPQPHSVNIQK